MTLRRGETLLLTIGIPVVFLIFFSSVHVISTGTSTAVDFVVPGILSSPSCRQPWSPSHRHRLRAGLRRLEAARHHTARRPACSGQGLDRSAGRGAPGRRARRRRLALGWSAGGLSGAPAIGEAVRWGCSALWPSVVSASSCRRAPPEVNLAAANGLYLVLLLLGGMIVPLAKLPSGLADVARLLPAAALSDASTARSARRDGPLESWVVLALWRSPHRSPPHSPSAGVAANPETWPTWPGRAARPRLGRRERAVVDGLDGAVRLDGDRLGRPVK